MKKRSLYYILSALLLCIGVSAILLSSCKKETSAPPIITGIRNYAPSPYDSIVQSVTPGQWVVLEGKNLSGLTAVLFDGFPATINNSLFSDSYAVIQVPSITFPAIPFKMLNQVIVGNKSGYVNLHFNVVGPPVITQIRNYAGSPNDTMLSYISNGQKVSLIGYNLKNVTDLEFNGNPINLDSVVFTDSSAIVKVPVTLTDSVPSLVNKITYKTKLGTCTVSILIFDPTIMIYYSNPLWINLCGGVDHEKTWTLDFNAAGVSTKFAGPLFLASLNLGWNNYCPTNNCYNYQDVYDSTWMPPKGDYGTMTFTLKGFPPSPVVTVNQKDIAFNGIFTGGFFLDNTAKTIKFNGVVPLNMGWDEIWNQATLITLTKDGMQLAFHNTTSADFTIYNYVPAKK